MALMSPFQTNGSRRRRYVVHLQTRGGRSCQSAGTPHSVRADITSLGLPHQRVARGPGLPLSRTPSRPVRALRTFSARSRPGCQTKAGGRSFRLSPAGRIVSSPWRVTSPPDRTSRYATGQPPRGPDSAPTNHRRVSPDGSVMGAVSGAISKRGVSVHLNNPHQRVRRTAG
jgi:hypothetical protein